MQQTATQDEQTIDARSLLSVAAHELNNELQVCFARIDLLEQRPGSSEVASVAHGLKQDAERLQRLVRDYLTYGELQRRPLCLAVEPVPVDGLLARVAEGAGLTYEHAPQVRGAPGVEALIDEGRIHQALWNLVRNAYRHGGSPVTLSATPMADHVLIGVSDCGAGFHEDMKEIRLGGRFSIHGGSGIGLWLANEIVEAHGGRLFLGQSLCRGAHVGVMLPRAA